LKEIWRVTMAEIHEPKPSVSYQSSGSRPIAAAIVTFIAGLWSAFNGYLVFLVGNYTAVFRIAMGIMMIGIGMILLGIFDIYVAVSVYNYKVNSKGFGIISNIGIILLNVIFVLFIGLIGLALCVISIILLAMLKNN